jgi:signal transduction histidine kinase
MSGDRELLAVARLSEALFETSDLDALIERALGTAIDAVGAESGSLLLADRGSERLVFRCSRGEAPVPAGTSIPWDQGIAGAVFQSGQAELVADVRAAPRHFDGIDRSLGHRTRDLLVVPLRRFEGAPIGVMTLLNKRHGAFGEADRSLLIVLASLTAVAILQAERFEEAKLAEVARALGSIAHDLKNLLTPVVSGAGLLKEELEELFARPELAEASASRELSLEVIELIQRTSERIQHRVREIADSVKGRSTPPVFAPCSLAAVAADVVRTLRPLAGEGGVTLVEVGLEALPEIHADAHRLYTALYNLVINAIPEVPPGGTITICGRAEAGAVQLEVQDTGRGIRPEILARLFTAGAISGRAGGTGLGTRIVKDVVEVHRGTIDVESEPGRTVFRLRFPGAAP